MKWTCLTDCSAHSLDQDQGKHFSLLKLFGEFLLNKYLKPIISYPFNSYADLYAASVLNLLHYPFSYIFRAPAMLMPHESTVAHEQRFHNAVEDHRDKEIATKKAAFIQRRADSRVPNLFANTPNKDFQTHELDDEDPDQEEEEKSSASSTSN